MSEADVWTLRGDLDGIEYAIADYIWRSGQHLDGVNPDSIAGVPVATANMAMTVIRKNVTRVGSGQTHALKFDMPACSKHFFKGHKWWCRRCDRVTEVEMREVVHALWELQGAGDRIVR